MTATDFPSRFRSLGATMEQLGGEIPSVLGSFQQLHGAAMADGALDAKTKELIALAIGIAVHCDGCISYHVHDALAAGATRAEVIETIGVAVLMGGGPSVVYGCDAMTALEQWANDPEFAAAPT